MPSTTGKSLSDYLLAGVRNSSHLHPSLTHLHHRPLLGPWAKPIIDPFHTPLKTAKNHFLGCQRYSLSPYIIANVSRFSPGGRRPSAGTKMPAGRPKRSGVAAGQMSFEPDKHPHIPRRKSN